MTESHNCRFCRTKLDTKIGKDIGLCPSCDEEANPLSTEQHHTPTNND